MTVALCEGAAWGYAFDGFRTSIWQINEALMNLCNEQERLRIQIIDNSEYAGVEEPIDFTLCF